MRRRSFDDAGGGRFFIRTHIASRYLTADASGAVKQAVKSSTDAQRWQLTPTGMTVLDRDKYAISNLAFPGKLLQPGAASSTAGAPVLLGTPTGAGIHNTNSWVVTSPLLASGIDVHP